MKSRTIRNRAARTDAIAKALHDHYRAVSIDKLLLRPLDAIRMAADAAHRSGELSMAAVRRLDRGCQQIETNSGLALNIVSDVLRTAMANRKAGRAKKDRV